MPKTAENLNAPVGVITPLAHDIHSAARQLSVAEPTIRKWIRQRRLPRVSGCRKILIPAAALEKFVTESVTTN
jgi:excisionase family DNA binding protein